MKKLAAILFFIYVINVRLDIKSVQYDGSLLAYKPSAFGSTKKSFYIDEAVRDFYRKVTQTSLWVNVNV